MWLSDVQRDSVITICGEKIFSYKRFSVHDHMDVQLDEHYDHISVQQCKQCVFKIKEKIVTGAIQVTRVVFQYSVSTDGNKRSKYAYRNRWTCLPYGKLG